MATGLLGAGEAAASVEKHKNHIGSDREVACWYDQNANCMRDDKTFSLGRSAPLGAPP